MVHVNKPADSKFPQIPQVLDPVFMRDYLQANWLGNKLQMRLLIDQVVIGEKRHKPGKAFQVSYELSLKEISTERSIRQVLTAQLLDGEIQLAANHADCGIDKANEALPTLAFFPDLKMWVRPFPHDGQLCHLPLLHDTGFLLAYFNDHPEIAGLAGGESIDAVDFSVLHYLPEKSCMTRYQLITSASTQQATRSLYVYGKLYSGGTGFKTYQAMTQLACQTSHCAKPLYFDETLQTLWQAHAPGLPLEWNKGCALPANLATQLAECIAAFHSSVLDLDSHYGFGDIFKQLDSCSRLAAKLDLKLGQKIQGLEQALLSSHKQIDWSDSVQTPLHCDLKMGNLLADGNCVVLIDLDDLCLGDPLADIGSFVANLYLNGLRAGALPQDISGFAASFLDAYRSRIDWNLHTCKLDWYVAAALIHEVVRRSIRQQDAERLGLVDAIIKITQHYLLRVIGAIN